MRRFFIIALLAVVVFSCVPNKQAVQQDVVDESSAVELTFVYTRLGGVASNQYAVWIENSDGQLIKSLYASKWTADGGYSRRPTSIPMWIEKSNRANMTKEQVDAVSGATPRTGEVSHVWDGTDDNGVFVPNGAYVLVLEATLRWENQAYYRAPITLGQGASTAQVNVEYVSGDRDTTAERSMISDFVVNVLR